MADIAERIRAAMNAARKTRDQARTLLYSTVLADLKNRELELKRPPTDPEAVEVLRRGVKRREEAAELHEKGGRPELARTERDEIALLREFLPPEAGPDDIRQAVQAAIQSGARDVGAVMKAVMPEFKGKADGKLINQIVREELQAAV